MPRKARIDAPGALHHIIARGIEKRPIFKGNRDRVDFLNRLEKVVTETRTSCYAWALIPNHFHLLLRTGDVSISTVMRRLLSGYAISFNRRHHRCGHLFQNRFKSVLCQEEPYLQELVRYIHLNPLRAKLVENFEKLGGYPYSGHSALTGKTKRAWQDTAYVLKLFGRTKGDAGAKYCEFVSNGLRMGKRKDLTGGGLIRSLGGWEAVKAGRGAGFLQMADERILGDGDFVSEVLDRNGERFERRYQLKERGIGFERVVSRVAEILDMKKDEILTSSKCRASVEARSIACFWASTELGLSQPFLSKRFRVTQPAICLAIRRGEQIVKERGYSLIDK